MIQLYDPVGVTRPWLAREAAGMGMTPEEFLRKLNTTWPTVVVGVVYFIPEDEDMITYRDVKSSPSGWPEDQETEMPETEQAFMDALTAVVDQYRNVLHKDRAVRGLYTQAETVRADETWTTYEGGPVAPEPPAAPTLDSLSPATAVSGDAADIVMSCIGTGFTPDSIIVFNGYIEPTTFVSDTEVTTGVKPSLFAVPAVCPVEVHTGSQVAGPIDFTFT